MKAVDLYKALSGPGAFRLLLSLAVFLHHTSSIAIGAAAVYIFLVLSGYWIAVMWRSKYSKLQHPYLIFLVSRMWRLLPVFIAVSAVAIGLRVYWGMPVLSPPSGVGGALALLSNVLILGYQSLNIKPLGSAWSLDIELQFYVIAPVVVFLFSIAPRSALLFTGLASLFCVWLIGANFVGSYILFFGLGIYAASVKWQPGNVRWWSLSAVLMVVVVFTLPMLRNVLIGGASAGAFHLFWNPIFNVALALLLFPYAMQTVYAKGSKFDHVFADMSYVIYLVHWIGYLVLDKYFGMLKMFDRLPYFLICWVVVLLVSYLVYFAIDRPFNRMRRNFIESRL